MEKEDNQVKLNNITESYILIESTPSYGIIYQDSNTFDEQDYFGEGILNYKLFKIKIWYGTVENIECITGIQTFYKERETNKVISPGEYRLKGIDNEGVETIELQSNEYFVDFKLSVNMKVTNIELTTNKGISKKVGGKSGEVKKTPLTLDPKEPNVILAIFGNYTNCLTCMGVYYISKKKYYKILYSGVFYLRHALRNKNFKNEVITNSNKLSKDNMAILKFCLMDDITFMAVIKFLIY